MYNQASQENPCSLGGRIYEDPLRRDYPFVFERTDGKETLVIAIHPSSKECSATLDGALPVLSQSTTQNGGALNMHGVSFFVGRKGN